MHEPYGGRIPPPTWRPAGRCAVLACDIVSFSDPARHDRAQDHLHRTLYACVERSFDLSSVPFADCYWEDRGDGAIIVVPPEHGTSVLLWPLIDRLRAEIARHNEFASEIATIGLRVAIHEGTVRHNGLGLVGGTVIHTCRMLDAPGFKAAVEHSSGRFGLIVSHDVYDLVVRPANGPVLPADYLPVRVQVKHTDAAAWMRIPGVPANATTATAPTADSATADSATASAPDTTPVPTRPARAAGGTAPTRDAPPGQAGQAAPGDALALARQLVMITPLAAPDMRNELVTSLDPEIATRIPRHPQALFDMYAILRTCSDFPGGVRQLLDLVEAIAGDSLQVRALQDLIACLQNGEAPR